MNSLKNQYPSIRQGGALSYGGSQLWSDNAVIKKCGCGVIAALDLIIYLERYHSKAAEFSADSAEFALSSYNKRASWLCRRYFPLIPPFGMNGLVLIAGLNRFFFEQHMPFRATWSLAEDRLWSRMDDMLQRDIPVILAIGPNFPYVWQKNRLTLYRKNAGGSYTPASSAKAHFVTVTGLYEEWMRISSWGKMYYVKRVEFLQYVTDHSNKILSSIVYIESRP